MATFFVRPVLESDARRIHDVHMRSIQTLCARDYQAQQIEAWGNRPYDEAMRLAVIRQAHVWVAELSGLVEGFVVFRVVEQAGEQLGFIGALYLSPEIAGQGAGRALVEAALAKARELGLKRVRLDSTLTSHGFYRRMGFRDIPGPRGHLFQNVFIDAIEMERWLRDAPPSIELVTPSTDYRQSFLEFLDEDDHETYLDWMPEKEVHWDANRVRANFAGYVEALKGMAEKPLLPRLVRDTVMWAVHDGVFVGRVAVRHELNENLRRIGGHVGYFVRPSFRRRGIASEMLRQTQMLPLCRKIGRLLLTCDETNEASIKTILKNGGERAPSGGGEVLPGKAYFWMETREIPR